MHTIKIIYIVLQLTFVSVKSGFLGKSTFQCAACTSFTKEVMAQIDAIDDTQTIEIGSYRIDPNGNQKLKKVPLSQSESHITEIVEKTCSKLNTYIQVKNSTFSLYVNNRNKDSRHSIIMTAIMKKTKLKTIGFSTKKLIFKCETILEDFEEDIIRLLIKSDFTKIYNVICETLTDYCDRKEVLEYLAADNDFTNNYYETMRRLEDDPSELTPEERGETPDSNVEEGKDVDNKPEDKSEL